MFQNRHGGLPLYFYKLWSYILPPEWLHPAWIAFWNALNLGLFFKVLQKFNSQRWIVYAVSFCLLIDPIFIYNYAFFISEPLTITCAFLCALLFLNGGRKNNNWAFYILGLGFYIRLNFLWFTIFLIPLIWKAFKENKKAAMLFFGLGILPQLVFMDWVGIFVEVGNYRKEGSLVSILYRSKDVLFHKFNYLAYFAFEELSPYRTLENFCAFLFLSILALKQNLKLVLFFVLSFLFSLFVIDALVQQYLAYPIYLFYGVFIFWLIVSLKQNEKFQRIHSLIFVLIVAVHVSLSALTLEHYKKDGFSYRHDFSLYKQVSKHISEKQISKLYLMNHTSRGILEFFLETKVLKTETIDFKNWSLDTRNINDLLLELDSNKGYVLIVRDDYWSMWHRTFYDYNFEKQLSFSKLYGVKTFDIILLDDRALIFYFEKSL